jgi:hypothetical protein
MGDLLINQGAFEETKKERMERENSERRDFLERQYCQER